MIELDFSADQVYKSNTKSTFTFKISIDLKEKFNQNKSLIIAEIVQQASKIFRTTQHPRNEHLKFIQSSDDKQSDHQSQEALLIDYDLPETIVPILGQDHWVSIAASDMIILVPQASKNQIGVAPVYQMTQKTITKQLKIYRVKEVQKSKSEGNLLEVMRIASKYSEYPTICVGAILNIFSLDKRGSVMKLNLFIGLLRRLKLIGIFLGRDLEIFMSAASGEEPEISLPPPQEANASDERLLQTQGTVNKQTRLAYESNGYKNKMDRFKVSLFLEGGYLIKTIVYDISWLLQVLGLILLKSMSSRNEVSICSLKFLKYQRKIHLIVMLVTMMDIYFYGARILLHRRLSKKSILTKLIAGINITLMTLDLLLSFTSTLILRNKEMSSLSKKAKIENPQKETRKGGQTTNRSLLGPETRRDGRMDSEAQVLNSKADQGSMGSALHKQTFQLDSVNRQQGVSINLVNKLKEFNKEQDLDRWFIRKTQNSKLPNKTKRKKKKSKDGVKKKRRERRRFDGRTHSEVHDRRKKLERENRLKKEEKNKLEVEQRDFQNQGLIKKEQDRERRLVKTRRRQTKIQTTIPIDHKKTIALYKNNLEVQIFSKSAIINDKKSFEYSVMNLYNLLEVFKLSIFQVSIASLPFSPTILLCILIHLEAAFYLTTLLPFLCWHRFIGWFEFITMTLKSVSLGGFLTTCFIISATSKRELRPVSNRLQNTALTFLYFAIAIFYIVELTRLIRMFCGLFKKFTNKKTKKVNQKSEKKATPSNPSHNDGLMIFYKDRTHPKFKRPSISDQLRDYQSSSPREKIEWENEVEEEKMADISGVISVKVNKNHSFYQ